MADNDETPVDDNEDEVADDDELDDGDEGDEEEEDVESDASGDSDGTPVGGSGSKGETPASVKPAEGAARPTGKDLIDLLGADPEAQRIMTTALENLRADQASAEQARKDAEAFQELIEKEDYAGIGQQLVERHRKEQARSEVADEILKAQFGPVYTKIFAQPEFQTLTAEEKQALDPKKFGSDAEYVGELQSFVATKRYEAKVNAEVERRLKERLDAVENEGVASKARKGTLGGSPAATGESSGYKTSADKIKAGFRAMIEPDGGDD